MKYSPPPAAWARVAASVDLGLRKLRRADTGSPRDVLRVWCEALAAEQEARRVALTARDAMKFYGSKPEVQS